MLDLIMYIGGNMNYQEFLLFDKLKVHNYMASNSTITDILKTGNPIEEVFRIWDVYSMVINNGFKPLVDIININPVLFIQKIYNNQSNDIYAIDINDWVYIVNLYPRLYNILYKDVILKGGYPKSDIVLFISSTKTRVEEIDKVDFIKSIWD